MDFWSQHGIFFVIGIVFWPRILLLYYGMIPQMQFPPILGFLFVPRMFLMSCISILFWDSNAIIISICWILAIIFDLIGVWIKIIFQKTIREEIQDYM